MRFRPCWLVVAISLLFAYVAGVPTQARSSRMALPDCSAGQYCIYLPTILEGGEFVQGAVVIAGGSCCIGGVAGKTLDIPVAFAAISSSSSVTSMRVRRGSSIGSDCFPESKMATAPWEPFVSHKTYTTQVAINWTTFALSVQYRDTIGKLSPVVCDDIAVEGMPGR